MVTLIRFVRFLSAAMNPKTEVDEDSAILFKLLKHSFMKQAEMSIGKLKGFK